jgi:hypothetical protein
MTRHRRRVAITGLGFVTPLGNDTATAWHALLAGRSGVAPITRFDATGYPVRIAAEVKSFDPRQAIEDRKLLKFANRSHGFAVAAAHVVFVSRADARALSIAHALAFAVTDATAIAWAIRRRSRLRSRITVIAKRQILPQHWINVDPCLRQCLRQLRIGGGNRGRNL